ncbi:MAG: hypothetical protein A2W29_04780 [Gemmatimonadetes bacterium RBG_16_66_8]|nr:MAG: hypothetical protein A2W29_04780 [Gemmatimonadetes bacterium RBG_16_66_8]
MALGVIVAVAVFATPVLAAHGTVPYQGTLKKDGQLYSGPAELKFAIFDGETVLWSSHEIDKRTGMPRGDVSVSVAGGEFSVVLGEPPMKSVDLDLLSAHPGATMRVWVGTPGHSFEQLSDQPVTSNSPQSGVPAAVWSLKGNRGTDPPVDFFGTTDDRPLLMKTNSATVVTLGSSGPVEVHKSLLVHGNQTVDRDLTVVGSLSTSGSFSLSGSLSIGGSATVGGNLSVAGGVTAAGTSTLAGVTLQSGGVSAPGSSAFGSVQASGLAVAGDASCKTLTILGGSDLAEPFPVDPANAHLAPPGTVMRIDPNHAGRLVVCTTAYDHLVAGVVSGANGVQPGLVMSARGNPAVAGTHNVALSGRVFVRATAANGPIAPGDLLTSSDSPGCAMKATESERSRGAVIGKAMSSLEQGRGLVLLLVQPQ